MLATNLIIASPPIRAGIEPQVDTISSACIPTSRTVKEAISQMMNLSMVTGTELAEASTIAANQLRVFQMDASKTGEVADILEATAAR